MTPQTINPPELIEHSELVAVLDEVLDCDVETCCERSEIPTVNPLEGLSVDRIRLRSSRRLR